MLTGPAASPRRDVAVAAILVMSLLTGGCALAAGIFRAGFWTGVIIAVLLIVVVLRLLRRRQGPGA